MEKALSLCIPAYNEGRCIGTGLDSALSQSFDGNVDIAVCANGCTDNTADVVRKYSARYPNISLIETGERGKPNAWNLLRRRAKHNVVIFGDGDVYFDRDAFAFLYDDVMNGGKVVYGARCVPALDKVDRVTRFFDMGSDYYQHCLIGKLYAFDNSKLQETLERRDVKNKEMPRNIINEDFWLQLATGQENYEIDERAKVFYTPCKWTESLRVQRRILKGILQMQREYPEWYDEMYARARPNSFFNLAKKFLAIPSTHKRTLRVLDFLVGRLVKNAMKLQPAGKRLFNSLDDWEVSAYSKTPIVEAKL